MLKVEHFTVAFGSLLATSDVSFDVSHPPLTPTTSDAILREYLSQLIALTIL